MTDTPRLLRYTKVGPRKLLDGELWVAIVTGSPGEGGNGVILKGRISGWTEGISVRELMPKQGPGDAFMFSANAAFAPEGSPYNADREVWGLDAVPPEVGVLWMRFKHLGKL